MEGIELLEPLSNDETTGLVRGVARLGAGRVQVLDVERLEARVAGLFEGR